jgi:hypothetical protein
MIISLRAKSKRNYLQKSTQLLLQVLCHVMRKGGMSSKDGGYGKQGGV